jgi:hypothetical protein
MLSRDSSIHWPPKTTLLTPSEIATMTGQRKKSVRLVLFTCCALTCQAFAPALAQNANAGGDEVGRELGAVLAWRLTPEIVESSCREPDPAGAEARQKALQNWLDKNAPLIKSVDERIAEVAPLALQTKEGVDPVWVIHRQVGAILKESLFAEKKPEEIAALCKAEADPANPHWNNNGMPHIPNALAALYDWKVQHSSK